MLKRLIGVIVWAVLAGALAVILYSRVACAAGYCGNLTCWSQGDCYGRCVCVKTSEVSGFCAQPIGGAE